MLEKILQTFNDMDFLTFGDEFNEAVIGIDDRTFNLT